MSGTSDQNRPDKERTIAVNLIARVEGEGALRVTVEGGQVKDVELRIFEPPRYFEAFLRGHPDVEAASKVAGEGCYHVTVACADDAALEAFTESLLRYGRYKVATELRVVKR